MRYGSVCSGIEAATSAWHVLGWEPVFFSEIEPFPSAVLKAHYPHVPNHGDMTKFKEWPDADINVLVGGTPCQSFSVAGLRKGLDDPRGNLMLTYIAIAQRYRPTWVVWENVPGVLSSNGGADFACLLRGLEECGYGLAYRVLDAQYFGVAQRRRRVFVVGCLGDWRRAAAVLFERHSLSGHPAPSREKGQRVTPTVTNGPPFSRTGNERVECEAMVCIAHGQANAEITEDICSTLNCNHEQPIVAGNLSNLQMNARSANVAESRGVMNTTPITENANASGQQNTISNMKCETGACGENGYNPAIAFKVRCGCEGGGKGYLGSEETAFTLSTLNDQHLAVPVAADGDPQFTLQNAHGHAVAFTQADVAGPLDSNYYKGQGSRQGGEREYVATSMQVRRLTPVECERLQGFPDNHTKIAWRNKQAEDCPDGPRYKALGNSMAVPVMRWIGKRIQMLEEINND